MQEMNVYFREPPVLRIIDDVLVVDCDFLGTCVEPGPTTGIYVMPNIGLYSGNNLSITIDSINTTCIGVIGQDQLDDPDTVSLSLLSSNTYFENLFQEQSSGRRLQFVDWNDNSRLINLPPPPPPEPPPPPFGRKMGKAKGLDRLSVDVSKARGVDRKINETVFSRTLVFEKNKRYTRQNSNDVMNRWESMKDALKMNKDNDIEGFGGARMKRMFPPEENLRITTYATSCDADGFRRRLSESEGNSSDPIITIVDNPPPSAPPSPPTSPNPPFSPPPPDMVCTLDFLTYDWGDDSKPKVGQDNSLVVEFYWAERMAENVLTFDQEAYFACKIAQDPYWACLDVGSLSTLAGFLPFLNWNVQLLGPDETFEYTYTNVQQFGQVAQCDSKQVSDYLLNVNDLSVYIAYMFREEPYDKLSYNPSTISTGIVPNIELAQQICNAYTTTQTQTNAYSDCVCYCQISGCTECENIIGNASTWYIPPPVSPPSPLSPPPSARRHLDELIMTDPPETNECTNHNVINSKCTVTVHIGRCPFAEYDRNEYSNANNYGILPLLQDCLFIDRPFHMAVIPATCHKKPGVEEFLSECVQLNSNQKISQHLKSYGHMSKKGLLLSTGAKESFNTSLQYSNAPPTTIPEYIIPIKLGTQLTIHKSKMNIYYAPNQEYHHVHQKSYRQRSDISDNRILRPLNKSKEDVILETVLKSTSTYTTYHTNTSQYYHTNRLSERDKYTAVLYDTGVWYSFEMSFVALRLEMSIANVNLKEGIIYHKNSVNTTDVPTENIDRIQMAFEHQSNHMKKNTDDCAWVFSYNEKISYSTDVLTLLQLPVIRACQFHILMWVPHSLIEKEWNDICIENISIADGSQGIHEKKVCPTEKHFGYERSFVYQALEPPSSPVLPPPSTMLYPNPPDAYKSENSLNKKNESSDETDSSEDIPTSRKNNTTVVIVFVVSGISLFIIVLISISFKYLKQTMTIKTIVGNADRVA